MFLLFLFGLEMTLIYQFNDSRRNLYMKKWYFVFVMVMFFSAFIMGDTLITPEKYLGFKPGTDRQLAHYNQIKDYFLKAAEASPRVKTFLLGKTTLGNDMVMSVISSPENMNKIDRLKEISRKLALAEVNEKEATELVNEGKTIVFITCNLHSSEIASSQMSLELIYHLATDNSPETMKILSNVVLVLMPSVNPDGQIMEVEYYNKYKGTKYEGSYLPYLYHWYAGHDNNRDWYKYNLKETWLVSRELYHNWFPQILTDEHQMGSEGDRFFIPPFADPPTPGLHPLVWRTVNLIGSRIALDLEKKDYTGVASRGIFTGWWIGALDDSAWFHNIAGILFEGASVRLATPIYIEPEEVRSPESRLNEERMASPFPWKGGWWRLGDIVNYDYYASLSVLDTAATYSKELLLNSYKMASDNIKKGNAESPFAYIIPKNQRDPLTAEKYIQTLRKSNVKVFRLVAPLQIDNSYFPEGSFVVPMAQPFRSFAKNILEYQRYPDVRKSTREEKSLPYDGAGWTLHLGMGVNAIEIAKPFDAQMKPVEIDDVFKKTFTGDFQDYLVLNAEYNNSFLAASVLLKKGIEVWRNYSETIIPKGAFIVKKSPQSLEALKEINNTAPLIIDSMANLPVDRFSKLKPFKVAVYQNWAHNMEEGWTRYVLDEFKIDFETLHPQDFKKKDILKKYDVLLFVGASETEIESGKYEKKYEKFASPTPPEYSGGIEKTGKEALYAFLNEGKTIIFMTNSCQYAIEQFKLPIENIAKENKAISCPGSYLEAQVKDSELTFGLSSKIAIFFNNHAAFETNLPPSIEQDRRTPVVFGTRNLLLSGALDGEDLLARKSLVVDYSFGKGRIVLIGPDIIFRAQSEGTYKILFNAIFSKAK